MGVRRWVGRERRRGKVRRLEQAERARESAIYAREYWQPTTIVECDEGSEGTEEGEQTEFSEDEDATAEDTEFLLPCDFAGKQAASEESKGGEGLYY